jgi:parvulin-like peptidyl-prolyl isomerase
MRLRGRVSAEELARLAPRLRQDALQGLIAQLLLRHEVEEAGIVVAEEALDEHLAQLREGMAEGQVWEDALRRAGATEQSVREQVRAQLRVEELVRTRLPEVEPPEEEEIRAFFDANAERLAQPELVDVRLLVLRIPDDADEAGREAVRQQARRLKEDAEAGASFEALVAEHSQDPRTRETGGLVAGLPRAALPEALFDADPGTISEPIESPSAVQLARVEQRTPGRPRALEEVHDQVASLLAEQRRQAALRRYIAELSAEADIQILVGETAPPTPPTPPEP